MADRTPREASTRANTQRTATWQPPNLLPDPNPREGVVYRWIRTATLGQADAPNVSTRFREGWEPVPAEDVPEIQMVSDKNSRFPGNVEVGGLLLCRNSVENSESRRRYYEGIAANQIKAADQALMRERDARMPMHVDRQTQVTFGSQRTRN
jgi:hypothetical protein